MSAGRYYKPCIYNDEMTGHYMHVQKLPYNNSWLVAHDKVRSVISQQHWQKSNCKRRMKQATYSWQKSWTAKNHRMIKSENQNCYKFTQHAVTDP